MGYYNTRLALWEPLIEPVEKKVGDSMTFEPWELKLELSMNEPDDGLNFTSPTSERGDEVSFKVCINILYWFDHLGGSTNKPTSGYEYWRHLWKITGTNSNKNLSGSFNKFG